MQKFFNLLKYKFESSYLNQVHTEDSSLVGANQEAAGYCVCLILSIDG
jgi:hypothetical protein